MLFIELLYSQVTKPIFVKICYKLLSLSTVVLNSRDRQGMYGMQHIRAPINKPHNSL